MKKLSFSISQSSKPSNGVSKKRSQTFNADAKETEQEASRSYVTEFNPGQDQSFKPAVTVIAPLENTWDWRGLKKMKNLELPISARAEDGNGLHFEAAPETEPEDVSYGLTLRNRAKKEDVRGGGSAEDAVLQRLKFDIASLPEDQGMAEFEDVPVEGFGMAVLAGYGWKEGQGIGRNAKEDVKIVEYTRRGDKQGIGFLATDLPIPVVDRRGDSNGKSSSKVQKDAILGKEMRIVGDGREAGMKGRVVERLGDGDLAVKLSKSGETVRVGVREVAEIGSREENRCLRRLKEERPPLVAKAASWVASGIRVKVISREMRRGSLYLKKGKVVDVVGPGKCDVSMEEGEILQGVSQDALETVVPGRGGRVLVLLGKRRGVYGSLEERDSERGRGVVKDFDTHEMVEVGFDQIAEFVGDPGELGY